MQLWTWNQTLARRLEHNYLSISTPAATQAVSSICGIQAQVPAAAELGVGIRTKGLTRQNLQQLISTEPQLTRTYAMRGTAYLLPTNELPLYAAAMRYLYRGQDGWFTQFGLSKSQADQLFAATAKLLDGQLLERSELVTMLRQEVGDWVFKVFDETLAFFVVAAAYAGVIAYGPARGSKATFTLPRITDSQWSRIDEKSAAYELARRYFAAYGPATHTDLARWLGIKVSEASTLIAHIQNDLQEVEIEGKAAWLPRHSKEPTAYLQSHSVHLLPQYDSYILGAGPLELIVPPEAKELIRQRKGGRYEGAAGIQVLFINGRFAGVWSKKLTSNTLHIKVEPLKPLTQEQKNQLEAKASHIAAFYQSQLSLAIL